MKILVTGVSGQLGFDVMRQGKTRGYEMIGTDIVGTNCIILDITDKFSVEKIVFDQKPDVIIHCSAYTAVDKAEEDRLCCYNVNVLGTENLVLAAKEIGAKFMYFSTDYVFDGQGTAPFTEESPTNPLSYYGQTKLAGEEHVKNNLSDWFIVRISWVYGVNGNNFVKTMLKLAETKKEISVISDQFGSPTYTFDLARLVLDMIATNKYGIYHATNEGICSWADFAKAIFQYANKNVVVNEITTEQYPTKAQRPKNSRMSKEKLVKCGFTPLPNWQTSLKDYINKHF